MLKNISECFEWLMLRQAQQNGKTSANSDPPVRPEPSRRTPWRKGIHAGDGLENLDDLVVPRQRRNQFLLLLPHQRRRIDGSGSDRGNFLIWQSKRAEKSSFKSLERQFLGQKAASHRMEN